MSTHKIRRGDWFRCYRPRPYASRKLICFPQAGGGASFFRPWIDELPADVELWSVQYPGREDRFRDPYVSDMDALADEIADALETMLDRPAVIFGHSMGASVGYEVARRLLARKPGSVERLFVSARPSPSHQRASRTQVYLRDDDMLVAELGVLGGTDAQVLDHPELRSLVLPTIRNDFRLIETYHPAPARPLDIPVVALAAADDPRMTVAQAGGWVEVTRADFRLTVFTGGHFYLVPHLGDVVAEVVGASTEQERSVEPHHDLTEDGVRAAVAQLMGVEPHSIGVADNLLELGVDSIKLMALASRWQRHGVEVPFGDLAEQPTIAEWSKLLVGRITDPVDLRYG